MIGVALHCDRSGVARAGTARDHDLSSGTARDRDAVSCSGSEAGEGGARARWKLIADTLEPRPQLALADVTIHALRQREVRGTVSRALRHREGAPIPALLVALPVALPAGPRARISNLWFPSLAGAASAQGVQVAA